MFEFKDKKLGSLKFISVSEARANFADCLKNDDSNIVITRHGVPSKVFVNYEDYMALKNAASTERKASPEGTLNIERRNIQEEESPSLIQPESPIAGDLNNPKFNN